MTPGEAAFMEGQPAAARTPESLSIAQQLRDMLEGKPAQESFAERARASKVDKLSDYLINNNIPLKMVKKFKGQQWQIVADYASEAAGEKINPPGSAESIQQIQDVVAAYEKSAKVPVAKGMTPAQLREGFQQARTTRSRKKAPPAAPAEPSVPPAAPVTEPAPEAAVPPAAAEAPPAIPEAPQNLRTLMEGEKAPKRTRRRRTPPER
jgi:hypothetical protein